MVALVRAVKSVGKTYPVGYMEATRRGMPLVVYHTNNEVSIARATWLCEQGNKRVKEDGLPWSCFPPKSEPQSNGWWRPTAAPGAIAAAYKYFLRKG